MQDQDVRPQPRHRQCRQRLSKSVCRSPTLASEEAEKRSMRGCLATSAGRPGMASADTMMSARKMAFLFSERALVCAVGTLVGVHVAREDCIHAVLEQHLLHGSQHVVHLVLMRRVAVVPARRQPRTSAREGMQVTHVQPEPFKLAVRWDAGHESFGMCAEAQRQGALLASAGRETPLAGLTRGRDGCRKWSSA